MQEINKIPFVTIYFIIIYYLFNFSKKEFLRLYNDIRVAISGHRKFLLDIYCKYLYLKQESSVLKRRALFETFQVKP